MYCCVFVWEVNNSKGMFKVNRVLWFKIRIRVYFVWYVGIVLWYLLYREKVYGYRWICEGFFKIFVFDFRCVCNCWKGKWLWEYLVWKEKFIGSGGNLGI